MPYETRQGFKNWKILNTIADNDRVGDNVCANDEYFVAISYGRLFWQSV
jgi:hypothetical protein